GLPRLLVIENSFQAGLLYAAIIRLNSVCQEHSLRRRVCGVYSFSLRDRLRRTRREKLRMTKPKQNNNKPKLNLTVREEQRNKLEQMASLENRSLSNLIEVMADERWKRLAEQQGVAYAKTVAEAMNLNL